jgi:hypothetical protein
MERSALLATFKNGMFWRPKGVCSGERAMLDAEQEPVAIEAEEQQAPTLAEEAPAPREPADAEPPSAEAEAPPGDGAAPKAKKPRKQAAPRKLKMVKAPKKEKTATTEGAPKKEKVKKEKPKGVARKPKAAGVKGKSQLVRRRFAEKEQRDYEFFTPSAAHKLGMRVRAFRVPLAVKTTVGRQARKRAGMWVKGRQVIGVEGFVFYTPPPPLPLQIMKVMMEGESKNPGGLLHDALLYMMSARRKGLRLSDLRRACSVAREPLYC